MKCILIFSLYFWVSSGDIKPGPLYLPVLDWKLGLTLDFTTYLILIKNG
jgi:hypothetical protein